MTPLQRTHLFPAKLICHSRGPHCLFFKSWSSRAETWPYLSSLYTETAVKQVLTVQVINWRERKPGRDLDLRDGSEYYSPNGSSVSPAYILKLTSNPLQRAATADVNTCHPSKNICLTPPPPSPLRPGEIDFYLGPDSHKTMRKETASATFLSRILHGGVENNYPKIQKLY